ncbi:MAG: GOLPH3/VPS74 family protein [Actinocrinis sp.]
MTLAADLLLLAIDPQRRRVLATEKIDYALMGAELVDLAISGRVVMAGDRVEVVDARPTGDDRLDAALMSLAGSKRPPRAKAWVQSVRKGMRADYLGALADAHAIQRQQRPLLRVLYRTEYLVLDTGRQTEIRARIDAIAYGAGRVDSPADRALAGLVHACGLANAIYPGGANRSARKRLQAVARAEKIVGSRAGRSAGDMTIDGAADASSAAGAASTAAAHAVGAAVSAATDAAIHAALHAAVDATHHAGSSGHDGGAGAGGHHGG